MNATQTSALSTPTCAVAYFAGFAAGEAYPFGAASVRQVVLAFSRAVAGGRAAKGSFRAYTAGWLAAEAEKSVAS